MNGLPGAARRGIQCITEVRSNQHWTTKKRLNRVSTFRQKGPDDDQARCQNVAFKLQLLTYSCDPFSTRIASSSSSLQRLPAPLLAGRRYNMAKTALQGRKAVF